MILRGEEETRHDILQPQKTTKKKKKTQKNRNLFGKSWVRGGGVNVLDRRGKTEIIGGKVEVGEL